MSSERRVLLLGLDGASWRFLREPWVAERLPALGALTERSASGTLWSTVPPYTGPAWTTITTGVNPGRHGVFGFTDAAGRPVSDTRVGAPRLWDYVGRAGGRSVVVNVPLTHPPRPIEGVLVSGMPAPPGAPFTYPDGVASALEADGYVVDVAVHTERGGDDATVLRRLERMTLARGRATARLLREEAWDLAAVVFVLPDRLGHPWWKHLVSGTDHFDTAAGERTREAAGPALRALDAAVEQVLAALPAGTAVVACSDHGFGPLRANVFFDLVLQEAGLIEAGAGVQKALGRIGRTALARAVPGVLQRRVRERLRSSAAAGERRAWTTSSYERAVRLADTSPDLRRRVADLLGSLRTPEGDRLVRRTRAREDLYTGPYVAEAPELHPELVTEEVELHEGLHAPQPWVSREDLPWGTHAADGIVALESAGVQGAVELQAADVAATVLDLLGLRAEGLDGRSLAVSGGPVREVTADVAGAEQAYDEADEQAVLEHLRGLGYVD